MIKFIILFLFFSIQVTGQSLFLSNYYNAGRKSLIVAEASEPEPTPVVGDTISPEYTPTYYVANDGNDSNDGLSSSTPWQTLSKVNSFTFSPGDTVCFKTGDKWEEILTPSSSGSNGNLITYGAYGTGLRPKIYGSEVITGWTVHSGNIYKATASSDIKQLFVDGERMMLARTPNTSYYTITTKNSSTQFVSTDLDGGINYTGASCSVRTSDYNIYTQLITSSSSQTLTMDGSPSLGADVGEGFVLTNKLEFLDSAGEWYCDTATNIVYLWMPESDSPSSYEVRGTINDYGVRLETKNYIKIRDLDIRHSSYSGIHVSNSDYIELDNNEVHGCNQFGIYNFSSASTNLIVTNNVIDDVCNTGIRSFSPYCTITGNSISNIGLLSQFNTLSGGEGFGLGVYARQNNMTINYNRIINIGYCGINFFGTNTQVKYNYIQNSMVTLGDGGAIYTYSGNDVNAVASEGSEIMYNIIDGCFGNTDGYTGTTESANAVYMDDGINDVTIKHNTVSGSGLGIFFHINQNNVADSNLVYNCTIGLAAAGEWGDSYFRYNTVVASDRQAATIWWATSHQRMTKNDGASPIYDYNTYVHHYATDNQFSNDYNFTEWKSATGQDANSTFDGSSLGAGETEVLFYNDTTISEVQDLSGYTWRDLSGASVTSLTLDPFTSKILIRE